MRRRWPAVVLLLVLGWTSACVPDVEAPEVRLEGVRLGGFGLQGGLLYARLLVENPNDFALVADGLTYELELRDAAADDDEWLDIAEGTFGERVQVGANESATVEIPIEFRYEDVGAAIRSVLATGALDYRVRGTVALEEPVSTEIPYAEEGTVSLLESG